MSDFFEDFSDEVEDNAGGYAALGGLAALSNQGASLKKLSGIQEQLKEAQAASAKTEKERLALEQAQKSAADAVRELRILMADSDTLLEKMSQMVAAPSGGDYAYDLDLTRTAALIQVKLELVEKNSAVLSDLADLKEQRRLRSQFENRLSELFALKHLPENPLSFVEEEVFDQLQHIWTAFGPVEELSNERALKSVKGYLISEEKLLSRKQGLTKALERLDQVKIQSGVAGRFTKNHFEETKTLWGQFYFLKEQIDDYQLNQSVRKRPDLDFSGAVSYLKRLIDEPQLKEQMEGGGADALATLESHITCARDQGVMLRDAANRIILGDFELARSAEQIPKVKRYAHPLFAENHNWLVRLDGYTDCFSPSIDFTAADLEWSSELIKEAWLDLGVESWPDDSDLKQRISKNKNTVQEIISKKARKNTIVWTVTFVVTLSVFFGWAFIEGEKEFAVREAEMKAAEAAREARNLELLRKDSSD